MTDAPEPDDLFADIVAGLDLHEPKDTVNAQSLSNAQLSAVFNEVRDQLIQMGEMMEPKTDVGRDLHSRRAAYLIEMSRRGMR